MWIVVLAAFVVLGENIDYYTPVGATNVEFAFIPSNLLLMLKVIFNPMNMVERMKHGGERLLAWRHNSASGEGTNALDAPSILCHEPICLPLCIIHKVHPLACPACYCPMPSFPPFRLRFPPPPPPPPPPPSILPFRPRELARPQFRPHILSPHIPFPPLPPLPPGVHLLPFPRLHNLISRKSNINPEVKM